MQFREVRTVGQGTAGDEGGGGRAPVKHTFRSHTIFPCDHLFFQSITWIKIHLHPFCRESPNYRNYRPHLININGNLKKKNKNLIFTTFGKTIIRSYAAIVCCVLDAAKHAGWWHEMVAPVSPTLKLHGDYCSSFILNSNAKTERAIMEKCRWKWGQSDGWGGASGTKSPAFAIACQCKLRERAFAANSSAFCRQLFTIRTQTKRIKILIR